MFKRALTSVLLLSAGFALQAQEINLYSARHYQTDDQLYNAFTQQTGIKINRIEANDAEIMERLKNEGANSPADVILMVDAARLWRTEEAGLFQPVHSEKLNAAIPEHLRGGTDPKSPSWFGFSTRARIIVYNKNDVKPEDVATYQLLADPRNQGKVCTRSGSHPYMLSLVSSILAHDGPEKTLAWAKGMVKNMARAPKGGDTDQITGVASGECGVALANTYYYLRLLNSTDPKDQALMKNVDFVIPNQNSTGMHVNVAGGGVAKHAPHREDAIKFLEYLATPEAQRYFAQGNNEWPVVPGVDVNNPALEKFGDPKSFRVDTLSIATIGANQVEAQKILDKAGYK